VTATESVGREVTIANASASDGRAELRLDSLTTEVGWLLVTAGVIGVIAPGIPGTPFLIVGVLVITPGGTKLLSRWVGKNPPRIVKAGMKQIGRFLDDLERRYPHVP
jgi:hypothetical protein